MGRNMVIIPAKNPDRRLCFLVETLSQISDLQIIVINDGSDAEYEWVFDYISSHVVLLTHTENMGKGHAIKTGLSYVMEHGQKQGWVVTADADGQHLPQDILRMLSVEKDGSCSVVLGVRRFDKNTPARSRIGNWITSIVFFILSGVWLSDTQTGLRAFDFRLIPFLMDIKGERYEFEMNVLLKMVAAKIRFEEIPIETVYVENNKSSHFRVIRDSIRIYWNIVKFTVSSLFCFGVDYGLYGLFGFAMSFFGVGDSTGIVFSNICARIISSICNFGLNRRFVFEYKGGVGKAAARYFLLVSGILCANTALLFVLVSLGGMEKMIAKALVECTLFLMSFSVQRLWIFQKRNTTAGDKV